MFGLTLVELMITIALVAVLGTIAAPTFIDLRLDAARTATVNDFFHALFLARSEAIKRGQMVTLCPSSDGQACGSRDTPWTAGWIVFINEDRDEPAERDGNEAVVAVYGARDSVTITSNRPTYSFRPHVQGVVNGTIIFCDRRGAAHARAIIISHTGRPRVSQRDPGGRALVCR